MPRDLYRVTPLVIEVDDDGPSRHEVGPWYTHDPEGALDSVEAQAQPFSARHEWLVVDGCDVEELGPGAELQCQACQASWPAPLMVVPEDEGPACLGEWLVCTRCDEAERLEDHV